MAVYYLDTSALVKRYAQERGTAWMLSLTDVTAEHDLYTVRMTGPEMIAALSKSPDWCAAAGNSGSRELAREGPKPAPLASRDMQLMPLVEKRPAGRGSFYISLGG
jgi:hypothetical protein